MNNKNNIFKSIFCLGAVLVLISAFVKDDGIMAFSLWDAASSEEGGRIMFFALDSEFFLEHWVLGVIFMFWLPAVLIAAAAILIFAVKPDRWGQITGIVGMIVFIAGDLWIISADCADIGTYLSVAGVIIGIVGIILTFCVEEKHEPKSNDIFGEIKCISGEYAGGVFPCENVITVGRDAKECNIILNSNKVSHVHCIIRYVPETDTYTVRDKSKNGTFFEDGQRLVKDVEMQVKRGTILCIGDKKENRFLLD